MPRGARGFLERVWSNTNEPRTFSALDLDKERLSLHFRRFPWVRSVAKIEVVSPPGVVVRLEYRAPVAVARLSDRSEIAIDREGVLLPIDEIDREAAGPLVGLHKFPPPSERRYGEVWSRLDPATGVGRRDEPVLEAATLAAFLKARLGEITRSLPEPPGAIVHLYDERGLYVQISSGPLFEANSLMVFWAHDAWADPTVSELSDDQKWSMLRDWIQRSFTGFGGKAVRLRFTRQGAVVDTRYDVVPTIGRNERRSVMPNMPR